MVSLPALEDELLARYPNPDVKGPSLAVEAYGPDSAPVVALVSTLPLDREEVNGFLRREGFAAIYSIREIRHWESIPLLGSGKTDYRAIKSRLEDEANREETP